MGIPTVTTILSLDRWKEELLKLEKMVLKKSNKIIATSKRTRSQLIKRGVEKERISVIYNGVDFQEISNTKLKSKDFMMKYGVLPNKKIILSVHNFHKKKTQRES